MHTYKKKIKDIINCVNSESKKVKIKIGFYVYILNIMYNILFLFIY